MQKYADDHREGESRAIEANAEKRRPSVSSGFHVTDNRPQAIQMRQLQTMVAKGAGVPLVLQRRGASDLLTRGQQGKLNEGEVELTRRPDVGAMRVSALEQTLGSVGDARHTPVADALASQTANIANGRVQLKGIEGASDPVMIARQVSQLQPKETRIQQPSPGRFELQAKLNPWVSVVTGRSLPELPLPEGQSDGDGGQKHDQAEKEEPEEERKEAPVATLADGTPHRLQPGVVWRSAAPDDKPLREYGDENTYATFMAYLAEVDASKMPPELKQQTKSRLLSEFHHHLKNLPAAEVLAFGKQLHEEIKAHEANDSLELAFRQNRAIYRAWHEPKRISEAGDAEGLGNELVGADSLNVALSPERFRAHKARTTAQGGPLAPLGAVPSSLLYFDPSQDDTPEQQRNTVFLKDRGTATALLPENLNAGFSAFNETTKALLRQAPREDALDDTAELREHAKTLRASVTRPVFFDKSDIQSSTGVFKHTDKPGGPHVRKVHSALPEHHNPLRESLDLKLANPLRSNAIFYQTFSQYAKPSKNTWSEMVVKYRSTGHTAGLHGNTRDWVPGLQGNAYIDERLENSGKFSEEFARDTAKWADAPLKGEDFDPEIASGRKGGKGGKRGKRGKGGY